MKEKTEKIELLNRKKIYLNVKLIEEDAEEFESLKENLGTKHDTETVRVAIRRLSKILSIS